MDPAGAHSLVSGLLPNKQRKPFMSYYSPTSGEDDVTTLRAFLQQAVYHYPRLAAFSFTLEWPYHQTMDDYRSLTLRFHTEIWQRIGEYLGRCSLAHRHSPPTVLRWLWEAAGMTESRMVLLMNLVTLGTVRNTSLIDNVLQEMCALLNDAWQAVEKAEALHLYLLLFY